MLYSTLFVAFLALIHGTKAMQSYQSENFILVDLQEGGLTWRKGQKYCENRFGTELATIDSQMKQDEMANLMRSNGFTTDKHKAWLGGRDGKAEGNWIWRDGTAFAYTKWNPGEPNNSGGDEDCLMTWPHTNYGWNDGRCSSSGICPLFICNRPEDQPPPPPPNPCGCGPGDLACSKYDWAVDKNQLYWAWASPCSGSCSQAELLYGWRYATPEEWPLHPTKNEFYRDLPGQEWCAAKVFDPRWNHCDKGNKLVRVPDNSYNEQVLVHDRCPPCMCYKDTPCRDTRFAHKDPKSGLYWAWASPCSGGCSKLVDPLPYGWRRATKEEWDNKSFQLNEEGLKFFGYHKPYDDGPDGQQINSGDYPATCAANIFDPTYDHCDAINFIQGRATYMDDGSYFETLIVHDGNPMKCAVLPNVYMPFPAFDKAIEDQDKSKTIS